MEDRLDTVFVTLDGQRGMIRVCSYRAGEKSGGEALSIRLRELIGPFGSGGSRETRKP